MTGGVVWWCGVVVWCVVSVVAMCLLSFYMAGITGGDRLETISHPHHQRICLDLAARLSSHAEIMMGKCGIPMTYNLSSVSEKKIE